MLACRALLFSGARVMAFCGGAWTTPAMWVPCLPPASGAALVAGVPDLFVLHRGCADMIEIKAEDGVLSNARRSIAAAVLAAGGHVGVACDVDEALACLDAWDILSGPGAAWECRGVSSTLSAA
jgi:hypothetical protein